MSAPWRWLPLPGLLLLAGCETPPLPHTVLVRAELAQLVADEQPPCGAVRDYTRHGRLHYRVECESGRVYRVQVGADGRVTVKPYAP